MADICIGSKFWSFSANRRKYDAAGKGIYRAHFYEVEIVGEISRSWVVGYPGGREIFKVPKSDPFREKYGEFGEKPMIFTDQMVDDNCFVHDNRREISDLVMRRATADQLRSIAKILED